MERSSSLPPIGNVFWSEAAQGEWQLRAARPRELPPVPGRDDEVCRELEQPVADGDQDSGKRGRDSAGQVPSLAHLLVGKVWVKTKG